METSNDIAADKVAKELLTANDAVAKEKLLSDYYIAENLSEYRKERDEISTIRFNKQKRWFWILIILSLLTFFILVFFTIAFFKFAIIVRTAGH